MLSVTVTDDQSLSAVASFVLTVGPWQPASEYEVGADPSVRHDQRLAIELRAVVVKFENDTRGLVSGTSELNPEEGFWDFECDPWILSVEDLTSEGLIDSVASPTLAIRVPLSELTAFKNRRVIGEEVSAAYIRRVNGVWRLTQYGAYGVLSRFDFAWNGVFEFEVISVFERASKIDQLIWSDRVQQSTHHGDTFFADMQRLSQQGQYIDFGG